MDWNGLGKQFWARAQTIYENFAFQLTFLHRR